MNNKRSKINKQLQEWISKIDEEIEKLIQDRYLHTCTIRELLKITYKEENNNSDSGEEVSGSALSIEITAPEDRLSSIKSEKKNIKTKAPERQEEHDKARAWVLDRARAKKRRKKMSGTKENNKNASNTQPKKKIVGGNINLQGKTFKLTSSRDCVHQYAETIKAIVDYVGQKYTHGGDIRFMIENLQDYYSSRPPDPPNGASQDEIESWKKQLDMYWKRRGIYMDNKMKLLSLIATTLNTNIEQRIKLKGHIITYNKLWK
jgi:hypothetical protein